MESLKISEIAKQAGVSMGHVCTRSSGFRTDLLPLEEKNTADRNFSMGCPVYEETVELVSRIACPSCEVTMLNMKQQGVASRAQSLGIASVPAVVIDGKLPDCCTGRDP